MDYLGNLQNGEVVWQPGFTAAQDEAGRWTATRSFKCHLANVFSLIPLKGDPCTKDGWESLTLLTASVTEPAGSAWATVVCQYKGTTFTSAGDDTDEDILPTYNTSIVAQTEPIEAHKNFKDFTAEEWAEVDDYKTGKIIRDPADSAAFLKEELEDGVSIGHTEDFTPSSTQIELFEALDKGFTSFYSPRIEHTKRYSSKTALSSATMNKVGKIDVPDGAPSLSSGRDWLFMGADTDNSGDVYEIELNWLASGPTGWDSDFYD